MKLIEINRHFFKLHGEPNKVFFCVNAHTDISLNVVQIEYICAYKDCTLPEDWTALPTYTITRNELHNVEPMREGLGMAYHPASKIRKMSSSSVPDSMGDDIHNALQKLIKATGGDVTDFVCDRLQWTREEIENYLFAEQVDSVALAIYNIEVRKQAIIIGDQTGVGKGRMAASLIRYAKVHNMLPIFITQKVNLFSDIYRDLKDIGCQNYKPFTFNTTPDANITERNEDGEDVVIYKHTSTDEQNSVFKMGKLPNQYDFVLATYSQFQTNNLAKAGFMQKIAEGSMLILDESHNASGSGGKDRNGNFSGTKTYQNISNFAKVSKALCFLSATFAKRPDNMPIYAQHTCIQDANLQDNDLIKAIEKGGEALQEVLSAMLVKEGQLIRRENTYDGIEVNYIYMDKSGEQYGVPNLEEAHYALCNNVTRLMRKIVDFEEKHINPLIENMDKEAQEEGEKLKKTENKMGVSHAPYFSKVFQTVSQILLSIKAQAVADHAIRRLKEGKKVVIALANTIEATLKNLHEDIYGERSDNTAVEESLINTDYSYALLRGLETLFRYSVKDEAGNSHIETLNPNEALTEEGWYAYLDLIEEIKNTTTGISCSPIDVMIQRIEKELIFDDKIGAYRNVRCGEVTGRSLYVDFTNDNGTQGYLRKRKKMKKQVAFSQFQNNELDVLLINSSGATGASAHATTKGTNLKPSEVKPRCMIIAQCELNVNDEVQKRGRINRTGQLAECPPSYDYLISAIPAEKRLMMMLQKKLRSLDANTSSKQKQSTNIIDLKDTDFINKYGDQVAIDFLQEYPEINDELGDPCKINSDKGVQTEDASKKVSGRVALLDTTEQDLFYNYMVENYVHLIDKLKQSNQYDLEVTDVPLNAKLLKKEPCTDFSDTAVKSIFSNPAYMCQYECDVLKKPMTIDEINAEINNLLGGKSPNDYAQQIAQAYKNYHQDKYLQKIEELNESEKREKDNAKNSPKYKQRVEKEQTTWQEVYEEIGEKYSARRAKAEQEQARQNRVAKLIQFFYAGRACLGGSGIFDLKCICLGVRYKSKQPETMYRPSNIAVRFATANSTRLLEFSFAKNDEVDLSGIYTKSSSLSLGSLNENEQRYLDNSYINSWNTYCAEAQANRKKRYIITGNLLKGYDKALQLAPTVILVNFTLQDGGSEKGILLPEDYNPEKNGNLQANFTKSVEQTRQALLKYLNKPQSDNRNGWRYVTLRMLTFAGTVGLIMQFYSSRNAYIEIRVNDRKSAQKDFISDPRWIHLSYNDRGFESRRGGYELYINNRNGEAIESVINPLFDILADLKMKNGTQPAPPAKFEFTPQEIEKYFGENTEIVEYDGGDWEPADFTPKKPTKSSEDLEKIAIAKAKMKMAKAKIAIARARME